MPHIFDAATSTLKAGSPQRATTRLPTLVGSNLKALDITIRKCPNGMLTCTRVFVLASHVEAHENLFEPYQLPLVEEK